MPPRCSSRSIPGSSSAGRPSRRNRLRRRANPSWPIRGSKPLRLAPAFWFPPPPHPERRHGVLTQPGDWDRVVLANLDARRRRSTSFAISSSSVMDALRGDPGPNASRSCWLVFSLCRPDNVRAGYLDTNGLAGSRSWPFRDDRLSGVVVWQTLRRRPAMTYRGGRTAYAEDRYLRQGARRHDRPR